MRLLLVVYLVVLMKPSLPILRDTLEHTFNEFNHLGTVHFENGKYHLHEEIKKEVKNQSENSSHSSDQNSETPIDLYIQPENELLFTLFYCEAYSTKGKYTYSFLLTKRDPNPLYSPPDFI